MFLYDSKKYPRAEEGIERASWHKTQFPRDKIGLGRAADRQICVLPTSDIDSAISFKECARSRQQDAERELLSLQVDPECMQRRLAQLLNSDHYREMEKDEKWRELALDVWAPVFRRVWAWDYIALWAELMVETRNQEIPGILYFIVQKIVSQEYGPMIQDLLVESNMFSKQLNRLAGKTMSGDRSAKKLEGAKKVTMSDFKKDPLFWAMANLAADCRLPNLGDAPQKLPLTEILEVAAQAVKADDAKTRDELLKADALGMVDDLAALSCIASMLESLPGFTKFETKEAFDLVNAKHAPFLHSHEGGFYASSTGQLKDVFESDQFDTSRLAVAGELLKQISASKGPQWSHKNLLLQLNNAKSLRSQLDGFWKELSERRLEFLVQVNGKPREVIDILPDVRLIQQGYEDESDLLKIQQNIDAEEKRLASMTPADKKNKKKDVTTYTWFPPPPPCARDRAQEVELSKKRERAAERDQREEQARVAAGAAPTPDAPILPPPDPIRVEPRYLEMFAWFWPYSSGVIGTSLRITWDNCEEALRQAGMTQSNRNGSHVTFTGRYGSMILVAPHARSSAKMELDKLKDIGRTCTSELRWTWDTFDPDAVAPVAAAGDDGGDDGGDGGDRGDGDEGGDHDPADGGADDEAGGRAAAEGGVVADGDADDRDAPVPGAGRVLRRRG